MRGAESFRAVDLRRIISALAIAMSAYHLGAGWVGEPIAEIHRPIHLTFALLILFGVNRSEWPGWCRPFGIAWDLLMSALTLAAAVYLFVNHEAVQSRMIYVDLLSPLEIGLAIGLIIAILDASRRCVGWVLVLLVSVFLAYAAFGFVLPAPFWHRGYSFSDILETAYLTHDGIWGTPVAVTASFIFLFVLFGSFLLASGAGEFFTDFARGLTGRTTGGAAKTAVVSSAFMGMLSGSSAANVVTTGSFTIPTMKRAGYGADFAGGVEAVASAGGQLTPPIMGAAAFIMVEFTGESYLKIISISIIPALLYFIAVFCMVDIEARRLGLRVAADVDIPALWPILKRRGYLILPIVVMIYVLIQGYTPARAALWAIIWLMGLQLVLDPRNRRRFHWIILEGMEHAPKLIGPVTTACAVGGMIVGVITLTGLGLRMSTIVLAIAGNSLLLLLILTMVAGLILGMGMPTSGAYIILAALLAPGMIKFGIPVLAAHMFVMWCAATSSITPPVAISSYAAAAVANSNPWKTSLIAFKLGLSSYIIPYIFIYGPPILGLGTPAQVAGTFATATIGVAFLSVAVIGWLFTEVKPWERGIYLVCALLMIAPNLVTDGVGLVFGVTVSALLYRRSRRLIAAAAAAEPATAGDSNPGE